jgi:hypothetical protein
MAQDQDRQAGGTGASDTDVGFDARTVTAVATADAATVRAMWIAMEVAGWYAIVPLSLASLVTGVVTNMPRGNST